MDTSNKTVSLVLTSGSARGLAHIGAIEELEKRGYQIKAVAGSSIGAAVGGLYAADKMTAYKEWMLQLSRMDVFNLFDFTFSSQGFLKGERVFEEMKRVLGDAQIEDCRIPYTAVATDLVEKKEVWMRSGSLFKAIRASVAIPTIITPVYTDDHILVDGGVSNPIPVEPVLEYQNELLIVINTNAEIPYTPAIIKDQQEEKSESEYLSRLAAFRKKWSKYLPISNSEEEIKKETPQSRKIEKLGYMSLLNQTINLMEDKLIELTIHRHDPDVIINVSRHVCSMFEFYKAHEVIEAGRQAAIVALDEFENKKNKQP